MYSCGIVMRQHVTNLKQSHDGYALHSINLGFNSRAMLYVNNFSLSKTVVRPIQLIECNQIDQFVVIHILQKKEPNKIVFLPLECKGDGLFDNRFKSVEEIRGITVITAELYFDCIQFIRWVSFNSNAYVFPT